MHLGIVLTFPPCLEKAHMSSVKMTSALSLNFAWNLFSQVQKRSLGNKVDRTFLLCG